jgi:uracil-DNA glycosylase
MFVGISAGRRGALISKVPLTRDASGRIFQRCLKELGLSETGEFSEKPVLRDAYITNLVKGRCIGMKGLNRLPTSIEVDYWFPRFLDEYLKVKPKIVVALGEFVFREASLRIPDIGPRSLEWEDRCRKAGVEPWLGAKLMRVRHPRYFQSRGALAGPLSKAFLDMTLEYRLALGGHTYYRTAELKASGFT